MLQAMEKPQLWALIENLKDRRRTQALHDNCGLSRAKQHALRQEGKENAREMPFVPGNRLRFSKLKIRLDPANGYDICDSLGRKISETVARWDPAYETRDARVNSANIIQGRNNDAQRIANEEQYKRLNEWRIEVRNWEIEVLLEEWHCGNTVIFPPGTEERHIKEAVDDLRQQNRDERINPTNSFHIGRPSR
ncbi:hypothetical protein FQN55_000590 [Onygenales sp. PD_40]|nr:hypothetical protein FQN55_000590 [Onygenales sp. PD_40]